MKSSEVCIKTRSPSASLPIQGQVTKHTTVKWSIQGMNLKKKSGINMTATSLADKRQTLEETAETEREREKAKEEGTPRESDRRAIYHGG